MRNVDDISAMRLRHVEYAIPAEFFGPFVAACVEIMQMQPGLTELVLEAFRWSIIEGLSIVISDILWSSVGNWGAGRVKEDKREITERGSAGRALPAGNRPVSAIKRAPVRFTSLMARHSDCPF